MTVLKDSFNHKMKQGDLEPPVRRKLVSKENSGAIDLSGATAKFFMMDIDGNLIVDAAAVIETPATSGIVRYDWQAGDTDQAGTFDAEFQITFSGGRIYTMPGSGYIRIQIDEELGS